MRLSIEAAVQHQYTPFIDEMKWRPTKARNGSTVTLVAGARRLSRWRESFYFVMENFISFARRKESVESDATPPASFIMRRINRQKRILLVMSSVDEPTRGCRGAYGA
ncbi:hypothetical protein [Burkholderia ambifaria]|uniref:hypothetical protein n=1 Tax=Burkholderia ambifaria TaxID=152480 RepID=UPI00158A163F|nr:hypothetical protein [Burkholderia ambifaria]